MAAWPGLEPRQTEPKSVVLPLHHQATLPSLAKYFLAMQVNKSFFDKILSRLGNKSNLTVHFGNHFISDRLSDTGPRFDD